MRTILHISDFHVTSAILSRGLPRNKIQIVVDALINDLSINFPTAHPDCIFITGDLAYHGYSEEYQIFDAEVISKIVDKLKVSRDQIFSCPGNHDVNLNHRSSGEKAFVSLMNLRSTLPESFGRDVSTNQTNKILASQSLYFDYVQRIGNLGKKHCIFSTEAFSYYRLKGDKSKNTAIISINSAMLASGGPTDRGLLYFPKEAIDAIVSIIGEDDSRIIALLHHPLDWLCENSRDLLKSFLEKYVDFVFTGHVHKAGTTTEISTEDVCVKISTGTLDETHIHLSYVLLHFDEENGFTTGKAHVRKLEMDKDSLTPQKAEFKNAGIQPINSEVVHFDIDGMAEAAKAMSGAINKELLINIRSDSPRQRVISDIFDPPRFSLDEVKASDSETTLNNGYEDEDPTTSDLSAEEIDFESVDLGAKSYIISGEKQSGKTTLLQYIHHRILGKIQGRDSSKISFLINWNKVQSKRDILNLCIEQFEGSTWRGRFSAKIESLLTTQGHIGRNDQAAA